MTTPEGLDKVNQYFKDGYEFCGGLGDPNNELIWKNFIKKQKGIRYDWIPQSANRGKCVCGHDIKIKCFIVKFKEGIVEGHNILDFETIGTECIKQFPGLNEEYNQLRSENRKECPIAECGKIHGNKMKTKLCEKCVGCYCKDCYKPLDSNYKKIKKKKTIVMIAKIKR